MRTVSSRAPVTLTLTEQFTPEGRLREAGRPLRAIPTLGRPGCGPLWPHAHSGYYRAPNRAALRSPGRCLRAFDLAAVPLVSRPGFSVCSCRLSSAFRRKSTTGSPRGRPPPGRLLLEVRLGQALPGGWCALSAATVSHCPPTRSGCQARCLPVRAAGRGLDDHQLDTKAAVALGSTSGLRGPHTPATIPYT